MEYCRLFALASALLVQAQAGVIKGNVLYTMNNLANHDANMAETAVQFALNQRLNVANNDISVTATTPTVNGYLNSWMVEYELTVADGQPYDTLADATMEVQKNHAVFAEDMVASFVAQGSAQNTVYQKFDLQMFQGISEVYCPCTPLPDSLVPKTQCDPNIYPFAMHETCIRANKLSGQRRLPADYGAGCKVHAEPERTCTTTVNGQQVNWCNEAWCFVDPCTCNAEDLMVQESGYFQSDGVTLVTAFSYANCGATNYFLDQVTVNRRTEIATHRAQDKCNLLGSFKCSSFKSYFEDSDCCGYDNLRVPGPDFLDNMWA